MYEFKVTYFLRDENDKIVDHYTFFSNSQTELYLRVRTVYLMINKYFKNHTITFTQITECKSKYGDEE